MMTEREDGVENMLGLYRRVINETPVLLSLLYDADQPNAVAVSVRPSRLTARASREE